MDQPGTYIVTQRLAAGCNAYALDTVALIHDSLCVTLDNTVLNFRAAINNSVARLDWTTTNKDISYFDVERSFDGVAFDFIGQVGANTGSNLSTNYSMYDDLSHLSIQPAIYYRLKIRKTSGAISYSKVIRIPYGLTVGKISVSPNPVHDMMQVTIQASKTNAMELFMYDMSGKIIRKMQTDLQAGTNVMTVDQLSRFQRGMYFVVIYTEGEVFREKIVIAK